MNHLPSLDQILAVPMPPPRLALDRSTQRLDQDGHLHVGPSVISAVGVSSYWGHEIPDFEKLGLRPNTEYRLFRPADELRKAAPTFANKPLLSLHRPVSAADHAHALTVGAIGSPVVFQGTDLIAPLVVWDATAIETIQDGSIKALSCGYRYRAVPQAGEYRGEKYTHAMTGLVGNHCALVEAGRVPTAMVGDAAIDRRNAVATNDAIAQLQQLFEQQLSGDARTRAYQLLVEITQDPAAQIAEDGLQRRVAASRWRRETKAAREYGKQFPGLSALKHIY